MIKFTILFLVIVALHNQALKESPIQGGGELPPQIKGIPCSLIPGVHIKSQMWVHVLQQDGRQRQNCPEAIVKSGKHSATAEKKKYSISTR